MLPPLNEEKEKEKEKEDIGSLNHLLMVRKFETFLDASPITTCG
jgi:hypothetical protein